MDIGLLYFARIAWFKQENADRRKMQLKHGTAVPERRTSMIKGKFVATIEIDIAVDENTPNLLPFEKLKDAVHNDMETAVKDILCEEFGDIATVKVTKTFADLYRNVDFYGSYGERKEGADND